MLDKNKVLFFFSLLLASTAGAVEDKEGVINYYGSSSVRNQSPSLSKLLPKRVLRPGMRPAIPSPATVSSPSLEVSQQSLESATSKIVKLQLKDELEPERNAIPKNTPYKAPSPSQQASRLKALLSQRSPLAKPPITQTSLPSAIPLQPKTNAVPSDMTRTEPLILVYPESNVDPVPLTSPAAPQSGIYTQPVQQYRSQPESLFKPEPQTQSSPLTESVMLQPQGSPMEQPEIQSRLLSPLSRVLQYNEPVHVQLTTPDPQPISASQPLSQPEPIPVSDPQLEPILIPDPQLEPLLVPDLRVESTEVTDQQLDPILVSDPQLEFISLPESASQPEPALISIPNPETTPVPDPQSEPVPIPEPVPQPDAIPIFVLPPESNQVPDSQPELPLPQPEQTPMPELKIELIPVSDPEPEPILQTESEPQEDPITILPITPPIIEPQSLPTLKPTPTAISEPTPLTAPVPTTLSPPVAILIPELQPIPQSDSVSETITPPEQLTTYFSTPEVVTRSGAEPLLPLATTTASQQLPSQPLPLYQSKPKLVARPLPLPDIIPGTTSVSSPQTTYPPTISIDTITSTTTAIPSTYHSTTNYPIPNPTSPIAISTLEDNIICKKNNSYYTIDDKCDAYVECRSHVPEDRLCPDGLHFNPDAVWPDYPCAYPFEVSCTSDTVTQPARPTEKCPRQYGYYPMKDGNCSKYMVCQGGIAKIMDCPKGLAFNPDLNSCDWPENVPKCNPHAFKNFACPSSGFDDISSDIIYRYRYFNSCDTYVACHRGFPRLLSCDFGMFFDQESQTCIDMDYVTDCDVQKQNTL